MQCELCVSGGIKVILSTRTFRNEFINARYLFLPKFSIIEAAILYFPNVLFPEIICGIILSFSGPSSFALREDYGKRLSIYHYQFDRLLKTFRRIIFLFYFKILFYIFQSENGIMTFGI